MMKFRNEEEKDLIYSIQLELIRAVNSDKVTNLIKEHIERGVNNENIAKGQSPNQTI